MVQSAPSSDENSIFIMWHNASSELPALPECVGVTGQEGQECIVNALCEKESVPCPCLRNTSEMQVQSQDHPRRKTLYGTLWEQCQ